MTSGVKASVDMGRWASRQTVAVSQARVSRAVCRVACRHLPDEYWNTVSSWTAAARDIDENDVRERGLMRLTEGHTQHQKTS